MSATPTAARDQLEEALARIADPAGEGVRACLTVYTAQARAEADRSDARARAGLALGPLDGVIVSIKDLFDVAGEPTRAGSKVLADASPATQDAPVVQRLRAAGAVIVAKTNMSEFAFSGVGTNPHYGTPGNPADRARVPGGSSSGAAVAVADGMCRIAIGSDTGGSTRIPAALCGIVGFKPTKRRVPTEGAFPISYTLDSIGPMARSVADCALADAIMAVEPPRPLEPIALESLRIGVAQGVPLQGLDPAVEQAFAAGLQRLTSAGARLSDEPLSLITELTETMGKGGLTPAEAYAIHGDLVRARGDEYDPEVRVRIERGAKISAPDYIRMLRARDVLIRRMEAEFAQLDVIVMPTTPITAPTIAEVQRPDVFRVKNAMLLRNSWIANALDLCAASLPLPTSGLPVGLMLIGRHGDDRKLLRIAAEIERVLQS